MYLPKNVIITGGLGFIGSNAINYLVKQYPTVNFINIDRVDYCSNSKNIEQPNANNYFFYKTDISNLEFITYILNHHSIDTVINFAAQSHVDNSFGNSIQFTKDNILGLHCLLECCRIYGKIQRFIHISTDEVYGEVSFDHPGCTEKSLLNPTNPYAATKAGAEFLARSYLTSFKLPIIITRGNNVYGPNQYPEKIIPKFISQLAKGEAMTIHGQGNSVRNFIHAFDVATAVEKILLYGKIGEVYNIGTDNEWSVLQIAEKIFNILKSKFDDFKDKTFQDYLVFVADRNFNDQRYAINTNNLNQLGWREKIEFEKGLKDTVEWYLNHPNHFENN